jgi:murein DD-endopeptidase MepM/ murein hydrolase activator NlpD
MQNRLLRLMAERVIPVLLSVLCATACQPNAQPTPFSVTLPPAGAAVALATAVPTTERPPTNTATPTPTTTLTFTPSPTPTVTATFTPSATPTFARVETFYLSRPIARTGVDWIDRNYPYGSTQLGRYPVHHGVEFQNPRGTPVLAAADGEIYYAGNDAKRLFGEKLDYYGNLVVIAHDFPTPEGVAAYTLYGHLDRIDVETGQRIKQGERIGVIGDTGIAIGPHLHFEVRLDDAEDFYSTRNPEMWLIPYPTFGTLAGRILDGSGSYIQGEIVKVKSLSDTGAELRYAYAYENDKVNPDTVWGENFTLGDLPQGDYEVFISDRNGKVQFTEQVSIQSGRITWVEIKLE